MPNSPCLLFDFFYLGLIKNVLFLQGLVKVFEEEYSGYAHRFYHRNMYANFKKKFGGGTLFTDLMMAASKATYYEAHEAKMMQIKEASLEAFEWLNVVPKHKWCKHAFQFYSKCIF